MIHCITKENLWEADPKYFVSLCGVSLHEVGLGQYTSDLETFLRMDDRCPECEAHPDFGLLILGEAGEGRPSRMLPGFIHIPDLEMMIKGKYD